MLSAEDIQAFEDAPTPSRAQAQELVEQARRDAEGLSDIADAIAIGLVISYRQALSDFADAVARWLFSQPDDTIYTTASHARLLREIAPSLQTVRGLGPQIDAALTTARHQARDRAGENLARQLGIMGVDGVDPDLDDEHVTAPVRTDRAGDRWAMGVTGAMTLAVAAYLVRPTTIADMRAGLAGREPSARQDGLSSQIQAQVGRPWMDTALLRYARDEVQTQYHDRFADLTGEIARAVPGVQKRWDSQLDRSVCPVCNDLDGKIVAEGESFSGALGVSGFDLDTDLDSPPAHKNCRCNLTIWHEDWPEPPRQ